MSDAIAIKTWTNDTASGRFLVYVITHGENFTVQYLLLRDGQEKSGPHGLVTFSSQASAEAFAAGIAQVIQDLSKDFDSLRGGAA